MDRDQRPCVWTQRTATPQSIPASGDATFRWASRCSRLVPHAGSTAAWWDNESGLDGSIDGILDISFGSGPQLVHVLASDVAFEAGAAGRGRYCGAANLIGAISNPNRSRSSTNQQSDQPGVWTEADVVQLGPGSHHSEASNSGSRRPRRAAPHRAQHWWRHIADGRPGRSNLQMNGSGCTRRRAR